MMLVYQRISCLIGMFKCIPKWTIIDHHIFLHTFILCMVRCSLILDHSQKDDYNKRNNTNEGSMRYEDFKESNNRDDGNLHVCNNVPC